MDECSTVPGIRYSLPKPVLNVTPNVDGSVTVDVLFFPDPGATYAIDSHSALAAASLDVAVSHGLLQRVGTAMDTTAVSAETIRAAGSITSDALRQNAVDAAARQTAINTAQTALDTAEATLAAAEAKLAAMLPDDEKLAAQTQAVAEARARRDAARVVLAREVASNPLGTPLAPSFTPTVPGAALALEKINPPTTGAATITEKTILGGGRANVFGGVLLAVDEGVICQDGEPRPTVKLRRIEVEALNEPTTISTQPQFPTRALGPKPEPKPNWTGIITVVLDPKTTAGAFDITTKYPIYALGNVTPPPGVQLMNGGTVVRIDVSGMNAGTYQLVVPFTYKTPEGDSKPGSWTIDYRVLVPKVP